MECIRSELDFSVYVLPETPAYHLLNDYWPLFDNVDSIPSLQDLLNMVKFLNEQWNSDISTQWLPFLNCNWKRFVSSLLEIITHTTISNEIILTWKYLIYASKDMKVVKEALPAPDLIFEKFIQIFITSISIKNFVVESLLAEHLLDLFCIAISHSYRSIYFDLVLVALSQCSPLWKKSPVFKQLLASFYNLLDFKAISSKQLQLASFRLLSQAHEPTDKRLLSALAFGESPNLSEISSSLLKDMIQEIYGENAITLPPNPSSKFLSSILMPPITHPIHLDLYPTLKEILAQTTTFGEPFLELGFSTLLLIDKQTIFVPSLYSFSTKDYFSRALMLHRLDFAQELKEEIMDAIHRLFPGPPRWARMGAWLHAGSPSVMKIAPPALGEFLPFSISLSLEIVLAPLPDVVAEWDSLRKGDLLLLLKVSSDSATPLDVRICELEGYLSADGTVLDSIAARKKISVSSLDARRILVVTVRPISTKDKTSLSDFNVVIRRDPKSVPIRNFINLLHQTASADEEKTSNALLCSITNPPIKLTSTVVDTNKPSVNTDANFSGAQSIPIKVALETIDKPVIILGSPGSGKSYTAAAITMALYASSASEKILMLSNSNASLDLLMEYLERIANFPQTYNKDKFHMKINNQFPENINMLPSDLIRLQGLGNKKPKFSALERLAKIEERRIELLSMVDQIAKELQLDAADHGASCGSAETFYLTLLPNELKGNPEIETIFTQLRSLQFLEVIHSQQERIRYLVAYEARIVVATLPQVFNFYSKSSMGKQITFSALVVDNASLFLHSEIALLLALFRVKRLVLLGDHMLIPPIIHTPTLCSILGQSLFSALIRKFEATSTAVEGCWNTLEGHSMVGTSSTLILLPMAWYGHPELGPLFQWRYISKYLVTKDGQFGGTKTNKGFSFSYQWIDIFDGEESEPTPNYYQNLKEAEYAVSLFIYMTEAGYDPSTVSILTMYNGQKDLVGDILKRKTTIMPREVSSVDQFYGLSNHYIILSMVRTRRLGYLQDLRRWILGISRATSGLYVLGKWSLFQAASIAYKESLDLFSLHPLELHITPFDDSTAITIREVSHLDTVIKDMKRANQAEINDESDSDE